MTIVLEIGSVSLEAATILEAAGTLLVATAASPMIGATGASFGTILETAAAPPVLVVAVAPFALQAAAVFIWYV